MSFNDYLVANGFVPEQLSAAQTTALQAAWRASQNPAPATPTPVPTADGDFAARLAKIEAENARVAYIQERTVAALEGSIGNPEKSKQLRELMASAIADPKTDARAYDLALLRADRPTGPFFTSKSESQLTDEVLEAAVCLSAKLPGVEAKFADRTLEAAHSKFRRGIGLQELFLMAAERNSGYRGSARDGAAVFRAAVGPVAYGFTASVGPSTITVPGILSNVANKFLENGFLYTEQSWREIARVKAARDFKQMTSYRMAGANTFDKIAPGGEIKQGTLSELTYTNQVDSYGKMLGIDYRDYRNDDLGAFTGVADELGRGAGSKLNAVFWSEWLDDADFFTVGNGNYFAGGPLTLSGLATADNLFANLTKPDGTPMGIQAAKFVVPRALRSTARNLMADTATAAAESTVTQTVFNPWSGMWDVVDSVYLQSSAIAGSSSSAWYLVADPADVAVIEVAFLDGVETPMVETSTFDFDRLGIAMRGTLHFGVNKQEYRAAVKLRGT